MSLPQELWYLRHAESERNQIRELIRKKKLSPKKRDTMLDLILSRPTALAPITDFGKKQAIMTDEWLRANNIVFDRYYVSTHIRALQTAGHLTLPKGVEWIPDNNIRERSSGVMEDMTAAERLDYLEKTRNKMHKLDLFNFRPERGESFADIAGIKWPLFMNELKQDCRPTDKALVVNHGDNMWAARCYHEEWMPEEFVKNRGENSFTKIPNCMFLQYTRVDPKTEEVLPNFGWYRMFCPWKGNMPGAWHPIVRKTYSSKELLTLVKNRLKSADAVLRETTQPAA